MCTLHDCQPYLQHLGVNQTRLVVIESLEGEREGEERKAKRRKQKEGEGEEGRGRERKRESGEGGSFRKGGGGGGGGGMERKRERRGQEEMGGVWAQRSKMLTDISCPLSCAVSP